MELSPYLSFKGQCEVAFKFYERCLGGKIVAMITYGGSANGGADAIRVAEQDHACPPHGRRQDPDGFRCPARPL